MTKPTDDDIPRAEDAFPKVGILLTDAYERIVNLVDDHHELLPAFDEDWTEALRKSREEERKIGHDPEAFDSEIEEYWHHKKEANLFLRLEIEAKKLVACVRDPNTGETLQLRSDGWIPGNWNDYIPPGIWTDYIDTDDYEAPGPNGSFIRGALRPIFFIRTEFDAWLEKTFGSTQPGKMIGERNQKIQSFERSERGKLAATIEAIRDIWGAPVPGVLIGTYCKKINEWLDERKRDQVKEATVRRALKTLRSE